MKNNLLICILLFVLAGCSQKSKVKYIFLLIGDGMGFGQVYGTEIYLSKSDKDSTYLKFTHFPVQSFATTYSASNTVTCSAAAGTAMATGRKTGNDMLGLDYRDMQPLPTIAEIAKSRGMKVGIITNVSINHATPAAFYAHRRSRREYEPICRDAISAGFDFYGGGGIKIHRSSVVSEDSLVSDFKKAGYSVLRGTDSASYHIRNAAKILMLQSSKAENPTALPPAIDRREGDMKLSDILRTGIDFLYRNNKKGFFIMAEGGMIDWMCHANDARGAISEVADFNNAVSLACEFYLKHPEETVIVVTADHETGGMTLGNKDYEFNPDILKHQKSSLMRLSRKISRLRENKADFKRLENFLKEEVGLGYPIKISAKEEEEIRQCFEKTFVTDRLMKKTRYAKIEPLAQKAVEILNRHARIGWTTKEHTAAVVPVYALGCGAERFSGRLDNTDIFSILSGLLE